MEHYERLEHIVKKSPKDVVTEADHRSEEAIIAIIRDAFPDDAILAEESGHSEAHSGAGPADGARSTAPVATDHRITDHRPLDGTVNYAAGIPTSAPASASRRAADPRWAWSSTRCATRCSAPWRARAPGWMVDPSAPRPVTWATASSRWPCPRTASPAGSGHPQGGAGAPVDGQRGPGPRVDRQRSVRRLLVQWRGLSLWDLAAAGLIAEEAGNTVTTVDGGTWFDLTRPTRSTGLLAAPPAHHAVLLGLLRA
ncbi:MAG: inositol monophosphatase family protein [Chloroflexota bacterium]